MPHFVNQLLACLLMVTLLSVTVSAPAISAGNDLPSIGSQANATLTLEDEYRLGSMVVRELRGQGQILEDPELNEFIQSIGQRLSSQTNANGVRFQFFIVKDSEINAFALPGGFVGVNAGLLLATRNEDELAGVLAHEISHVTQRHIARSIAEQSRNSVLSTAAMLAAILLGAAAGGDAAIAGMAAAQSVALQKQMSFSRAAETEADDIGIGLLARAGFNPNGMWQFFEVLQRQNGGVNEADIPAILRSHPVTAERIAETRARASSTGIVQRDSSLSYLMMRERMRVVMTPPGQNPRQYYGGSIKPSSPENIAKLYGQALASTNAGDGAVAVRIMKELLAQDMTIMQFHAALGQAQLVAGDTQAALATLAQARTLFPRNVPITVRYAEILLSAGNAKLAHEVLLDLFNNVPPTQDQAKLIALAANAAGDSAEAYYYMSEYHLIGGDLPLAVSQLQMALATPSLSGMQRARFEARLEELQRLMPRRRGLQQAEGRTRLNLQLKPGLN